MCSNYQTQNHFKKRLNQNIKWHCLKTHNKANYLTWHMINQWYHNKLQVTTISNDDKEL